MQAMRLLPSLASFTKPSSYRTKCPISQFHNLLPTHLEQILLLQFR